MSCSWLHSFHRGEDFGYKFGYLVNIVRFHFYSQIRSSGDNGYIDYIWKFGNAHGYAIKSEFSFGSAFDIYNSFDFFGHYEGQIRWTSSQVSIIFANGFLDFQFIFIKMAYFIQIYLSKKEVFTGEIADCPGSECSHSCCNIKGVNIPRKSELWLPLIIIVN